MNVSYLVGKNSISLALNGIREVFPAGSEKHGKALAAIKAGGKKLGKPKGTVGKSKLDPYRDFIEGERVYKAPISLIARKLNTMIGSCTRQNLAKYMKHRNIK